MAIRMIGFFHGGVVPVGRCIRGRSVPGHPDDMYFGAESGDLLPSGKYGLFEYVESDRAHEDWEVLAVRARYEIYKSGQK